MTVYSLKNFKGITNVDGCKEYIIINVVYKHKLAL